MSAFSIGASVAEMKAVKNRLRKQKSPPLRRAFLSKIGSAKTSESRQQELQYLQQELLLLLEQEPPCLLQEPQYLQQELLLLLQVQFQQELAQAEI
jgi:hypothetical protein